MDESKMKNIVVLKQLPSNIIEEAFVVLKDNIKVKDIKYSNNKFANSPEKSENKNDYIVKEAELVVEDYICKVEEKEEKYLSNGKKLKEQYKKVKSLNLTLGIMLLLSLIMVILK